MTYPAGSRFEQHSGFLGKPPLTIWSPQKGSGSEGDPQQEVPIENHQRAFRLPGWSNPARFFSQKDNGKSQVLKSCLSHCQP